MTIRKRKYYTGWLFICMLILSMVWTTGCGSKKTDETDGKGDIIEEEGRGDLIEEEPVVNAEDFYGVWEYNDVDEWIYIHGDGTLYLYDENGEEYGPYSYTMDGNYLVITDTTATLTIDEDGVMTDSEGYTLFASELPEFLPDPFFEVNELPINYRLNEGLVQLANGGSTYKNKDGSSYTLAPLNVEIEKTGESDLGNGYKKVSVLMYHYFPNDLYPATNSSTSFASAYFFYDYYTGNLLPDNDHFSTGENRYQFNFDSNGANILLDIEGTTESVWNESGNRLVKIITINATMPVDYDGLVLAVQPQPSTYSERVSNATVNQQTNTYVSILDRQGYSPYASLFCRIY